MGDLQATVEFLVELYKFYNVDLFIRGYYQFRFTFKPPKSSHAIQVELIEGHGGEGAFTLFPAFVSNNGQTAVSRTINIYYKDEEVLLKDVFLFRLHLLIDSTKAADCIEKTPLEMNVDVHFTDQVVREHNFRLLPLVTSRTLKFHLSCFNGLHHQVPLLFDYYYFSVLDLIVHANVVSLSLPNWSILKQPKTGWFSKSTPRSSTPMFFITLFGNRYQLGTQFYSDVALKYALPSSSIARENFEKASAIHRNLCAILAMAHSQLLNYFEEMMQHLDEKQRIKIGVKLDPADLVEALCKKLETLHSYEEVFDEICSDLSVLNNELALLWCQFQESFALNDKIRRLLREQHHYERMLHFSEAFFMHQLPWKSLLNATDSSAQKHTSMGQCVKSSKYLSIIPPVTIECAEVDGDSSTTPIFFEDRYISTKETSVNEVAVYLPGGVGKSEDEVLEHKPLGFGILNEAFNDFSPQTADGVLSNEQLTEDTAEDWVNITVAKEHGVKVVGNDSEHNIEEGKSGHGERNPTVASFRSDAETNTGGVVDNHEVCLNKVNPEGSPQVACKETDRQNITAKDCVEGLQNSKESLLDDKVRTTKIVNSENPTLKSAVDRNCINGIQLSDIQVEQETMSATNLIVELEVSDSVKEACGTVEVKKNACTAEVGEDVAPTNNALSSEFERTGAVEVSRDDVTKNAVIEKNDEIQTKIGVVSSEPTDGVQIINENDNTTSLSHTNVDEGRGGEKENDADVSESLQLTPTSTNTASREYVGSGTEVDKASGGSRHSEESLVVSIELQEGEVENECINVCRTEPGSSVEVYSENTVNTEEACIFKTDPDVPTSSAAKDRNNEEIPLDIKCLNATELNTDSKSNMAVESKLPSDGNTNDSINEEINKPTNVAHLTLERRVSNSVFYERTSDRSSVKNFAKKGTSNEEFSSSTSNSSSDMISCFCGGKLTKTSSPYRPVGEVEKSNLAEIIIGRNMTPTKLCSILKNLYLLPAATSDFSAQIVGTLSLQKAKQEVKSRMNYCGKLYSDVNLDFVVRPYFMDRKPDLSLEPVHFVICVHGLDGNSGDLRLVRCFLEMALPSTKFEFLMSEINQDNTFLPFDDLTEKLVSEILHHMEAYRVSPSRISFIGHSLGNIIIRSALTHPLMEPYVELFHTFLSLSGPHLGMIYHTSSLVSTGLWLMQKWKKSASLLQLSLNDSTDMRETFLYKLSKKKGLEYFTNVLLVSSVQDHYVPFHSSRIELPKTLARSNSQECSVYREMIENILTPLLSKPNRTFVRYGVYHCLPSSTNTFIGRAAHIAMLDSEIFIEKLICRSAAKYFQ